MSTGSSVGLPLLLCTGELAVDDPPPSDVPTSDKLNGEETDPPPLETSTTPLEDPSELDQLEEAIITYRKRKTIGDSDEKREESVKIAIATHLYL